jgi:hypothetical protein
MSPRPPKNGAGVRPNNCKPRKKGQIVNQPLSTEDTAAMEADIMDYTRRRNLGAPTYHHQYGKVSQINSKDGHDRSMPFYIGMWAEIGRFAWQVGTEKGTQTATICSDKLRPRNCLPMDDEIICLFWQHKGLSRFVACTDKDKNQVIYQNGPHKGKPVMGACDYLPDSTKNQKGGWSAPTCLQKCRSAIRTLHRHCFPNDAKQYTDACYSCYEKNVALGGPIDWASVDKRQFFGCLRCGVKCNLNPCGDPSLSAYCEGWYKRMYTILQQQHTVKGALQLTPKQVREIREYLTRPGPDSFRRFQLWVMFLMGIRLFLRFDEVTDVEMAHFRIQCFAVLESEIRIDKLVLFVNGKADLEDITLSIFRDDENKEFCLVRALLIYLAMARITKGLLFPKYENLKFNLDPRNTPNNFTLANDDGIPYTRFLDDLKVRICIFDRNTKEHCYSLFIVLLYRKL